MASPAVPSCVQIYEQIKSEIDKTLRGKKKTDATEYLLEKARREYPTVAELTY